MLSIQSQRMKEWINVFPHKQWKAIRKETYKTIWTKIQDLKNVRLIALPVFIYKN